MLMIVTIIQLVCFLFASNFVLFTSLTLIFLGNSRSSLSFLAGFWATIGSWQHNSYWQTSMILFFMNFFLKLNIKQNKKTKTAEVEVLFFQKAWPTGINKYTCPQLQLFATCTELTSLGLNSTHTHKTHKSTQTQDGGKKIKQKEQNTEGVRSLWTLPPSDLGKPWSWIRSWNNRRKEINHFNTLLDNLLHWFMIQFIVA